MSVIKWSVNLDEQAYSIELDHGIFSGKRIIQLNGKTVHKSNKFIDVGTSEHPFQVNDHNCKITIQSIGMGVVYKLYIDSIAQETHRLTYRQLIQTMPLWAWLLELVNGFMFLAIFMVVFQLPRDASIIASILATGAFLFIFYAIWIISSHKSFSFPLRFVACLLLTFMWMIVGLLEGCLCIIPQ